MTYDEVLKDMTQRDYDDSHRDIAPLREAEGAVRVDSSDLTLEQSAAVIRRLVESLQPPADQT